jgi:hypothetical protein
METSRARFALGELDDVPVDPLWLYQGVADSSAVECPKQLDQYRGVRGCTEKDGGEHLDLCWPGVTSPIDHVAEFVDALVEWVRDALTERLWVGLGEALVAVVAGGHGPSASKASFNIAL